jgi:hypothetical protein
MRFVPVFLVSLASIAFEILLSRYFAIAGWSEYGYWVISIAMVGYAASGVVLSLAGRRLSGRADRLLDLLPVAMIPAAAAGFHLATLVRFNPLELQNPAVRTGQLVNILGYYLALFPFFFLVGAYLGLAFMAARGRTTRLYFVDLVGAGIGSLCMLAALYVVHPFRLVSLILPVLGVAALWRRFPSRRSLAATAGTVIALTAGGILWTALWNRADFNEYKAIYAPSRVAGGRTVAEIRSPRGHFLVLDNFTERRDLDLSNNYDLLGAADPPKALGLYRDGNRATGLATGAPADRSYLKAALTSFPYESRRSPRVLLVGSGGGFRPGEVLAMGASRVTVLEAEPLAAAAIAPSPSVVVRRDSPQAYAAGTSERFDIIEIAPDHLDGPEANRYAYTTESLAALVGLLRPGGVLSVPVSIREFTVYVLKMVETAREALGTRRTWRPEEHLAVWRSAWSAIVLLSRDPLDQATGDALAAFCDRRSFDLSWYPGRPPSATVWNELPELSFDAETSSIPSGGDALAGEIGRLVSPAGPEYLAGHFFNLRPASDDRPFFHAILRLGRLPQVMARIQILPREELGTLVNLAVLAQAAVFALAILLLPLLRRQVFALPPATIARGMSYFASLGLGYLFVEIWLMEVFTPFLNDRTSAFGIVLAEMLVLSGFGSLWAGRHLERPGRGARRNALATCAILSIYLWLLPVLLERGLGWPPAGRMLLAILLIAPPAFCMGAPFPLGLALFTGERERILPWAWALNGAFSVVASPLSALAASQYGYRALLAAAVALYATAAFTFPDPSATLRGCPDTDSSP